MRWWRRCTNARNGTNAIMGIRRDPQARRRWPAGAVTPVPALETVGTNQERRPGPPSNGRVADGSLRRRGFTFQCPAKPFLSSATFNASNPLSAPSLPSSSAARRKRLAVQLAVQLDRLSFKGAVSLYSTVSFPAVANTGVIPPDSCRVLDE